MDERKKLYDFIQNIANQHSYDDYTRNMLLATVPTMIEYYGEEYRELFMKVISETRITFAKKVNEFVDLHCNATNQENVIEEGNANPVNLKSVRMANGFYVSNPVLSLVNEKIRIDEVKRTVGIKRHDENPRLTMATLIHELSHAVKAFNNEFTLSTTENGEQILTRRCGMNFTKQKLKVVDGKIVKTNIHKKLFGIAEGRNVYDEEMIFNMIIRQDIETLPIETRELIDSCGKEEFLSRSYKLQKSVVQLLERTLKCDINRDCLEGATTLQDAFEEKVGEGSFEKFGDVLDEYNANIYKMMQVQPFTNARSDSASGEMGYTNEFLNISIEMRKKRMTLNMILEKLRGIKRENISCSVHQALASEVVQPIKIPGKKTLYEVSFLNFDDKPRKIYVDAATIDKHYTNEDGSFNIEEFTNLANPFSKGTIQSLQGKGVNVEEKIDAKGVAHYLVLSDEEIRRSEEVEI